MTDAPQEVPPIVEVAAAVAETIATPTIPVLAEDLLLVHKIVGEVKQKLNNKHPALLDIFNILFHLQ